MPFFNWKLKKIKRQLMRLYRKKPKSEEYEKLKNEYESQFKKASSHYISKNVTDLKSVNPEFTVLSHQDQNLSPEECTQKILKYFTDISKEYYPLDFSKLPVRVRVKLLEKGGHAPYVEDYQVYNVIKAAKKTNDIPGDLPKKLLKEFAVELSSPMAKIFRAVLKTNKWPNEWAIEYGLALKKIPVPETESDL